MNRHAVPLAAALAAMLALGACNNGKSSPTPSTSPSTSPSSSSGSPSSSAGGTGAAGTGGAGTNESAPSSPSNSATPSGSPGSGNPSSGSTAPRSGAEDVLGGPVLASLSPVLTALNPISTAQAQQMKESSRADGKGLSSKDKEFVNEAAQGGLAEVQLGKLAAQQAESSDVKQFGQRMVQDHTKANSELVSLARTKGVTPPSGPSAKDKATMTKLSAMHGSSFDRAYMDDMVNDHKKDVADFERYAKEGTDPDLKAFAQKTLPVLQEHLSLAERIQSEHSSSGSPSGGGKM